MDYACIYGLEKEVTKNFLKLPSLLYDKDTLVQDIKTEKAILNGTHILSHYFKVIPIITLNEDDEVISRCLLTFYPDDENAYVGFYESFNEPESSSLLLKTAYILAKKEGKKALVGPLNASFWIGYRFKTNKFENVYTNEPYNKDYYASLWEEAGFEVSDKYYSNQFRIGRPEDRSMKCPERLQMIKDKGYEITSLKEKDFNKVIYEIYDLLIKVFSDFPAFKEITKEEFFELFKGLKYILDEDFVVLIYKDDELIGFSINIPNYYNLTHQSVNIKNLLKILKIKNSKDKEYILLYLGINPKHPGVGAAMAEIVKQKLTEKKAKSISALIHEGKISGGYYKELVIDKYTYVLMKKNID